jgi:hypothetical protein
MLISVKDKDDTTRVRIRIQLGQCVRIRKGQNYPKERKQENKFHVIKDDAVTRVRIRIQLVLGIRNQETKRQRISEPDPQHCTQKGNVIIRKGKRK